MQRQLKQLDAALASYDQAIAIKGDYAEAYCNRGVVLQELRRMEMALASFDHAIANKADFAEAYFNRSMALLSCGDFDRGWTDYEWRWRNDNGSNILDRRFFPSPCQPVIPTLRVRRSPSATKVTLNGTPKTGDSFAVAPTTNASYTVKPAVSNTGSGYADPIDYSGGTYSIKFQTPSTYQVFDASGNAVTSGAYTSGQAITFAGVQVTLTGTPAAGDTFGVSPSANQSLFTTVQNLVNAIKSGASGSNKTQLNNSIATGLNDLDQAISHTSTVQANVGGRHHHHAAVRAEQSANSTADLVSAIQGLDYAAAITSLDTQNTTLSAAMQAYTLTHGLSLFKYIS